MLHALVASVALGAVMTLGDYLWAALELRHRMVYGLVHGAALCLCIGAAVGWRAGRTGLGILAGPSIGLLAAGGFYVLAPALGYGAMFPMWMLFWICFAVLQAILSRDRAFHEAAARGLAAAILSGAVFYAISGIWTTHSPGGINYLRNFVAWTAAFLPGLLSLWLWRSKLPSP